MTLFLMFALGFLVAEVIAVGISFAAMGGHAPFYIVPRYWAENAERWESWRQAELKDHNHG